MTNVIISKKHRQVLVPYAGNVRQYWPNATTLEHEGTTYAVLPHAPREHVLLKTIGFDVPAPILEYYDWEEGKPFQVQKTTAAAMTSNKRCYVLNDMGTGKTKTALWSWRYLNRIGVAGKLLVVAPLSTLRFTWARECSATIPDCKVIVLHGTAAKRRKLLEDHPDAMVYIINHDGLKTVARELAARADIDTLVLDELAVYRNPSQRSKLMQVFAQRFHWCWGMSGRPLPNAPTDAFAQCKILTPHTVPKWFRHAQSILMTQVSQFKWVPKPNAIETAFSWMQPSVRFTLDDVVELPEAIYRTIDVELSPTQVVAYRKLANELATMVQEKLVTAANAGVALNKLLQLASGNLYTHNPEYVTLDSTPRQDALLEILEEAPDKVIVFAPWRHLIGELSKLFTDNDIAHAVVHGETTQRETIFSDFNSTNMYRVLLAHPGTLHHGLTLTGANTIIWYSPVTSLEIYEQANARIRRISQTKKQIYFHFQATPAEKRIYTLLRNKQINQNNFLELVEHATTGTDNGNPETEWQDNRRSAAE